MIRKKDEKGMSPIAVHGTNHRCWHHQFKVFPYISRS